MHSELVVDASRLTSLCEGWRAEPVLAIDTEFVRTRTFFARLGLVQIRDSSTVFLLDTVALTSLEPLGRLLRDYEGDAVFHSASEDLGIFAHLFGRLPERIFDTQVVASLVGLGFSRSYQSLVQELLGEELEKGETRSNWLRRPLSPSQMHYAAADVEYLPEVRVALLERAVRRDREAWVEAELRPLSDPSRYSIEPSAGWRRLKGSSGLDGRGRAILRRLCRWRDRQALRRDLARNFVVRDASLLDLARQPRTHVDDLQDVRDLAPGQRRRFGRQLVAAVEEGLDSASGSDDRRAGGRRRIPRQKELVRALQEELQSIAGELDVAAEVLAQKRTLEALVQRVRGEGRSDLPPELGGWRREAIGEPLLVRLDAERH